MEFQKAALIYNPVAGGARRTAIRRADEAAQALRRHVPQVTLLPTEPEKRADVLSREAVEQGYDLVAPCGGDGTINEALQGLVGADSTLLPLPAGTANVLAWEAGLPVDPVKAADALPELVVRDVEVGVLELPAEGVKRYFLLMCGAGVDAHAVYRLNLDLKRRTGIVAYFWSATQQLFERFERLEVRVDGDRIDSTLAVVSKSRLYGGKLVLTPHAHLLERQFDVVTFRSASPLVYTGYLAGVLVQQLDRFRGVRRRRATEIEFHNVERSPRVYVQVDGELAGRLPAKVRMGPETVRLLLPPRYVAGYPKQAKNGLG